MKSQNYLCTVLWTRPFGHATVEFGEMLCHVLNQNIPWSPQNNSVTLLSTVWQTAPKVFGDHLRVPMLAKKNKLMCYPQQLGRSWKVFGYLPRTLRNLISHLHHNLLEPHQPSAPEPSEPHRPSAPEPFGTSSAICPRTLRNLIGRLHRNPLEPRQPSAPELSGTSSAICTTTLWNLISHLHRKAPERPGTFSGTWCCSCTGSHRSYSGLKTP